MSIQNGDGEKRDSKNVDTSKDVKIPSNGCGG